MDKFITLRLYAPAIVYSLVIQESDKDNNVMDEACLHNINLVQILPSNRRHGVQYKVDKYIIEYLIIFKVMYLL